MNQRLGSDCLSPDVQRMIAIGTVPADKGRFKIFLSQNLIIESGHRRFLFAILAFFALNDSFG
jgi:hypothetical protein